MIDNYKNLTIAKYYEIDELQKEQMEDIERQVAIIAILSSCSEDEILDLPLDEYRERVQKTAFLFEQPKYTLRLPDKIKVGTKTYRVAKDVSKWTAGQYIDFQTYIRENLGLEYLLSCCLIPDGEIYGASPAEAIIEDIKNNLSIQTAVDITNFFQRALQRSIKTIQTYLGWMMKRIARKATKEDKEKIETARKQMEQMVDFLVNGVGRS